MNVLCLLTLWFVAHAQDSPAPDPVIVPSASLATEDGPGTLWVNPANMAYDPDPRWGIFIRNADPAEDSPLTVAATAGIGGIAAGLRWMRHAPGVTDVAFDLAASVRLPRRVSVGATLHWNIEPTQRNYVAFDAAVSWRPLPWLGASIVTRNIGSPGEGDAVAATGAGLALRPAGRLLIVGADYLHTFRREGVRSVASINARLRPTRGLYLRAKLDTRMHFGAGVEVYFGAIGLGTHVLTEDYDGMPAITSWIGSDERREQLAPGGRRINEITLNETPAYAPPARLFRRDERSWADILKEFHQVEDEPGLRGMLVTLDDIDMSWARWEELRARIDGLVRAGKEVVVYLVGSPSNGAIYAASAGSKLLVHPASVLRLTGLSVELVHPHGLLDAVGIDVQVARRSDFKSAAEPYTRMEPSRQQRQQQLQMLADVHDQLVGQLSAGRGRTIDEVRSWVDGGPYTAAEAETIGIVDGRAYPDQLDRQLERVFETKVRRVQISKQPIARSAWDPPAKIAMIYVEGPMVSGESKDAVLGGKRAGAETIRRQLERAARDLDVAAVVLRIDSPGGSTYAADEIWRAVRRVKAAGKPVVVSMGGLATSGGYYIASGADAIWAEPNTVTGSIGVIAMKPSISRLASWAGVRTTQLQQGRNAGMTSIWRGWDPVQQARMQALVDDAYETFKERVATGRGLTAAAVEDVARGRIWSGQRAQELGLVDHLGDLTQALDHARRLAGIGDRQPIAHVVPRERRSVLAVLTPQLLGSRSVAQTQAVEKLVDTVQLRHWISMLSMTLNEEPGLWMIDPWWMTIGPR
jgi:protease-4